jgi:hypothetical protein
MPHLTALRLDCATDFATESALLSVVLSGVSALKQLSLSTGSSSMLKLDALPCAQLLQLQRLHLAGFAEDASIRVGDGAGDEQIQ